MTDHTLQISVSDSQKNDLLEIIKNRSEPGIFILNLNGEFIYTNDKARDFFSLIPPFELQEELKRITEGTTGNQTSCLPCDPSVCNSKENGYCFRPFILSNSSDKFNRHILVIIEQVSRIRTIINLDDVRRLYGLTRREQEIVGLLLKGLGNKEISLSLFICEYTVKDHLKSIMAKLAVNTRLEVVSKLVRDMQMS